MRTYRLSGHKFPTQVRCAPKHRKDERALPAERSNGKMRVTQRNGQQDEARDAETEHRHVGGRQPLVSRKSQHNGLHAPDQDGEKHAERSRGGRGNAIAKNEERVRGVVH